MVSNCVFSINRKGGVGKTTCTGDLECVLSEDGFNVLAVDTDIQGSAYKTLSQKNESRFLLPDEYKTLSEEREYIFPSPDEYESFFKKFEKNPVKQVQVRERKDSYSYMNISASYFPVELFDNNMYANSFSIIMKKLTEENGYDFVFYDLPPFTPKASCPVVKTHECFDNIIPLIITRPTENEIETGLRSYEWFVDIMRKNENFPLSKLKPIMILNSYFSSKHRDAEKYIERGSIYSNKLNTEIPVHSVVYQQYSSEAKQIYSFYLAGIEHYYRPDQVDIWTDLDNLSMDGIFSLSRDADLEERKDNQRTYDYSEYLSDIRTIADHIQELCGISI